MASEGRENQSTSEHPLLFPPFRLLPLEQQLWRGGELVPLRPKAFAILKCLVSRAGQLVTREELLSHFWGDVRLSDGVIKTQIGEIRQALGDSARLPRFIETQHRCGYRFIGKIEASAVDRSLRESGVRKHARAEQPGVPEHFVGRVAELEALTQCWEKAHAGERQVVFVTGETGAGKSALVNTFLQRSLCAEQPPFLTWGQCIDQYGSGEPYLPIIEAVRRLCAGPDGDRVVQCLRQNAPTWLSVIPNLQATLPEGVPPPTTTVPGRMLREMVETLEALSARKPLLLALEDVHWADDSTLDLLGYLAQRSGSARLLVVATYRPREALDRRLSDLTDTLKARNRSFELAVPELRAADLGEYLACRFRDHRLPAAVEELLHQRTEGNPLFVVGLVDSWLARGFLHAGPERCELRASFDQLARCAPPGVLRMIEKELDRLDPFECSVLEAASVAGTEFSTAAVAAALGADITRVEEICMRWACRGQFFRSRGKSDWNDGTLAERYEFLHVLYQQHTCDRIGASRQAHLQLRLAERRAACNATLGSPPAELVRARLGKRGVSAA